MDRNIYLRNYINEDPASIEAFIFEYYIRIPLRQQWERLCLYICIAWMVIRERVEMFFACLQSWAHFQPGGWKPTLEELDAYLDTTNWMLAPIRYIACHPISSWRAVLTNRDEVLLYKDMKRSPVHLISDKQMNITCAAFRPWTRMELAVGGDGGIVLWTPNPFKLWLMNMTWLDCKYDDFIVDLQWLLSGTYLASATLGNHRIQIWNTDMKLLLQELCMSHPGCNFWALRYQADMLNLFNVLKTHSYTLRHRDTLKMWGDQLTKEMPLQTGAWTTTDNYFIFVVKGSSKVYGSMSTIATCLSQPITEWITGEIIDLSCFRCGCADHDGGPVQAIAMDPCNVYVAFSFKWRRFVLVCLLESLKGCRLILKPHKVIDCLDGDPDAYPTCINFESMYKNSDGQKRVLAIGWSTGSIQLETFSSRKCEVAPYDQMGISREQKLFKIGLN